MKLIDVDDSDEDVKRYSNGGFNCDEIIEVFNALDAAKYELMVFENVPAITHANHSSTLNFLLQELKRRDYHYRFRNITSVEVGGSVVRTRFICVAAKSAATMAAFQWPPLREEREAGRRIMMLLEGEVPRECFFAGGQEKLKLFIEHRMNQRKKIRTEIGQSPSLGDTHSPFYTIRQDTGVKRATVSYRALPATITGSISSGHFLWHNDLPRSIAGVEALRFHHWSDESIADIERVLKVIADSDGSFKSSLRLVEMVGDSVCVLMLRDVIRALADAHANGMEEE